MRLLARRDWLKRGTQWVRLRRLATSAVASSTMGRADSGTISAQPKQGYGWRLGQKKKAWRQDDGATATGGGTRGGAGEG